MASNGCNPMRWKCKEQDCFNLKQRPKIEIFAECLPGMCAFGDVDAITEIGGRGLVLEWKSYPMEPWKFQGQRLMWERFTKGAILSAIFIAGDAETMKVSHLAAFYNGKWHGWQPANLNKLKHHISNWAIWAKANPLLCAHD